MNIHPQSAWSEAQIIDYLQQANTPLRIACLDNDDYPIVCSLWFTYKDGALWAATHKSAHIIKLLQKKPQVGFEIATNEFPYKGVRGKADVSLFADNDVNTLEDVIDKYLQGSNQGLADWLLSRKDDEFALKISPLTINAWDFSHRMAAE